MQQETPPRRTPHRAARLLAAALLLAPVHAAASDHPHDDGHGHAGHDHEGEDHADEHHDESAHDPSPARPTVRRVVLSAQAEDVIGELTPDEQGMVLERLTALAENPEPEGVYSVHGHDFGVHWHDLGLRVSYTYDAATLTVTGIGRQGALEELLPPPAAGADAASESESLAETGPKKKHNPDDERIPLPAFSLFAEAGLPMGLGAGLQLLALEGRLGLRLAGGTVPIVVSTSTARGSAVVFYPLWLRGELVVAPIHIRRGVALGLGAGYQYSWLVEHGAVVNLEALAFRWKRFGFRFGLNVTWHPARREALANAVGVPPERFATTAVEYGFYLAGHLAP